MRPPARARPKDSPKEPPAELTPAASLTRSSAIGASVKLLSWETSRPKPDPVITRGSTRYHPESTLGTRGMMAAMPTVLSANPARTMLAGRRFPALRPASNAMPNIDSDSGASESPACMALYSSVIWRKSGRAIIAPPRVICWSICCEIPMRKFRCLKRAGSRRVGFPCLLRRTSQKASAASITAPIPMMSPTNSPPSCQTRMPSTTPPIPTTESTAPTASILRGPV